MLPLLKRLFTDETAFLGFMRFALVGIGGVAAVEPVAYSAYTGEWTPLVKLGGVAALAVSQFLRSESFAAHRRANGKHE